MSPMTPDQDELRFVTAMGPELGTHFYAIHKELVWVCWRWGEFRVLFVEKPSRIELMDKSAPHFFSMVYNAFLETTLLGIARLVGPLQSAGQSNLAIDLLPPRIDKPALKQEVASLIQRAKVAGKFTLEWRNKYIAHHDLPRFLRETTPPLPDATPEKIDAALSAIRNVVNRVELDYCNTRSVFRDASYWGAEALLTTIRDGLLRHEDKVACWKRGERHPDEINPPEEV